MHRVLKGALYSTQHDVATVVNKFQYLLHHQNIEITHNLERCAIVRRKEFQGHLWHLVIGHISHFTLNRVQKAYELSGLATLPENFTFTQYPKGWRPCSGVFKRVFGLPCPHTIRSRLLRSEPLRLEDFDIHWRINRHQDPVYNEADVAQNPRVLPRNRYDIEERRMPSEFERTNREINALSQGQGQQAQQGQEGSQQQGQRGQRQTRLLQ